VTTIRRLFGNYANDLTPGFDQGAALALLAKLSIARSLDGQTNDVRQWLDNMLCKWASTFADYRVGDPLSFKLAENIRSFPQFVYNIRRNPILRRFGLSLDEVPTLFYLVDLYQRNNKAAISGEHHSHHPTCIAGVHFRPQLNASHSARREVHED
jgi:hypothetical protein